MTPTGVETYRALVLLLAKKKPKPVEIEAYLKLSGVRPLPPIDPQAGEVANWTLAIERALDHDDVLDNLVDTIAQSVSNSVGKNIRDTYATCAAASNAPRSSPDGLSTHGDAAPGASQRDMLPVDRIRDRISDLREHRPALLEAKSAQQAQSAADAIHIAATELRRTLDDRRDWSAWPVLWTTAKDQEHVLSRIEARLVEVIRWSVYLLSFNVPIGPAEERRTLTGDDPAEGAVQERDDAMTRQFIDAQMQLAVEAKRFLGLVEQEAAL